MTAKELVIRNSRWNKRYDKDRPIVSNMRFTPTFEEWAKEMGVRIEYWKNLDDLIQYNNADIICDEVGTYFDSRLWSDLSPDVRSWLQQGGKVGIEFYGAAQDFAQVDKSFRRLCSQLFLIRKIIGSGRPAATKPPVKYIWGICMVSELDPNAYDEDKKKFASGTIIPSFFLIEREFCEIFYTGQRIEKSKPAKLRHTERWCELGAACTGKDKHKIIHT